jgi:hypothetical protein
MQKTILGSAMLGLIILGAVCGFVLVANMNPTEIITSMGQRGWKTTVTAEEGGGLLSATAGGVLQVYVYVHSVDPGTDYATNLTNVTGALCYAHANNLNSAMTGNVPFATAFDVLYKVRVNVSECYNTTGSNWETAWARANLTCANIGIGASTPMVGVEIANNTVWMWMNFYLNNGGAGYTITHGQQVNLSLFVMQCWM